MDALILSCGTGGGHNAAGKAVKEELEKRGHHVTMMDPYTLISNGLADGIGGLYIKLVQKLPRVFGVVYMAGELYRRLPFRSPVYFANKKPAGALERYLEEHPADVIIMPHLYPAEIITQLKNQGKRCPLSVFIATDYTCIPFTEETDCDYYVIPHADSAEEFVRRGIPKEKLLPYGIPVSCAVTDTAGISKEDAKRRLGLEPEYAYYLLAGGSVGAGGLCRLSDRLDGYIKKKSNAKMIIICGNNEKQYAKLRNRYADRAIVLQSTDQMALYLRAAELFLTKPGGLSSTEAAVTGVPLIMTGGIPGCETRNRRFFWKRGMCFRLRTRMQLHIQVNHLRNDRAQKKMLAAQALTINRRAREDICDFLEQSVKEAGKP